VGRFDKLEFADEDGHTENMCFVWGYLVDTRRLLKETGVKLNKTLTFCKPAVIKFAEI